MLLPSPPSLQFMSGRMHAAANCQYAVHEYLKAGLRSHLEVSLISLSNFVVKYKADWSKIHSPNLSQSP